MMLQDNAMRAGVSAGEARALAGAEGRDLGATATGANSQANSYGLKAAITTFTTAAATTGARLSANMIPGDEVFIANYGANSMNLYPPVGGNLNNAGANTAVALAANKGAIVKMLTNGVFHAIIF